MKTLLQWKQSATYRWLAGALLLFVLFLLFTIGQATDALAMPALQVERWLLLRPITWLDCMFFEWRLLGAAQVSLIFTLAVGGLCWLLGYRRRIILYLLLIVLVGVGIEVVGKKLFATPVPETLRSGMTILTCPQMNGQPVSVQLATASGMWWLVPTVSQGELSWIREVATFPLSLIHSSSERSYPGGHAQRWCFLGILLGWLAWKHVRSRLLRLILVILSSIMAFAGGFMQFYVGAHLITDTIAGYLLGASAACCAIGLLMLNTRNPASPQGAFCASGPQSSRDQAPVRD